MLLVGDWTRTVSPDAFGRVTFSLTASRSKVTTVTTFLDGVAQGRPLVGDDLRNVAAMYFQLPHDTGAYSLSVVAKDAAGCQDGQARPMTLVVK